MLGSQWGSLGVKTNTMGFDVRNLIQARVSGSTMQLVLRGGILPYTCQWGGRDLVWLSRCVFCLV